MPYGQQAYTWHDCEEYLDELVYVTVTSWLKRQRGLATYTQYGTIRRVTAKAVLFRDNDTYAEDWFPISQIERIEDEYDYDEEHGDYEPKYESYERPRNEYYYQQQQYQRQREQDQQREQAPPQQPQRDVRDPWTVLGLSKSAKRADLTTAYRTKLKLLHPDVNPAAGVDPTINDLLTEATKALNEAHAKLREFILE